MIAAEFTKVWGWEGAVRGMRDPKNSWGLSDSLYSQFRKEEQESLGEFGYEIFANGWIKVDKTGKIIEQNFSDTVGDLVGPNDMKLMKKLIAGGSEHRKFLRMIHVQMDVIAPLYWWKEYDTYKVGTVANSCSTMHKIHDKKFTIDDFSHEHVFDPTNDEAAFTAIDIDGGMCLYTPKGLLGMTCNVLNHYRELYLETKDKRYWWQMIQLLPSSYNQRRTLDFNYETAYTIIHQRSGHKLDEWHAFCDILRGLPYMEEFCNA